MTVFWAHISTPGAIEPGECCTRPVRRGTVRGRTSSNASTHDGSRSHVARGSERRPGGHRARHGRQSDSAHRLCQSGTEQIHTCALECGNVTLTQTQSRIGPGDQPSCESGSLDVEPREPPPRNPLGSQARGFGSEVLGAHTGHGAVVAVEDQERRPGGHRAAKAAWVTQQIGSVGSGTDHVHTVASSR